MKLAAAGYVIPFIFVYNPDLLLRDVDFVTGVQVVGSAVLAILLLATALEGHFMVDMSWYLRPVIAVGAVMMLSADLTYDLIGIGLVAAVLAIQLIRAKSQDRLHFKSI